MTSCSRWAGRNAIRPSRSGRTWRQERDDRAEHNPFNRRDGQMCQDDGQDRTVVDARHAQEKDGREQPHGTSNRADPEKAAEREAGAGPPSGASQTATVVLTPASATSPIGRPTQRV